MGWIRLKQSLWTTGCKAAISCGLGFVMFGYVSLFIPHEHWRYVLKARRAEQLHAAEEKMKSDQIAYLIAASAAGDIQRMRKLFEEGADVNGKSDAGVTPLISAASGNHSNAVRFLLARRANKYAKTNEGFAAVDFAGYNKNETTARLLWTGPFAINDAALKAAMNESRSRMIWRVCLSLLSERSTQIPSQVELLETRLENNKGFPLSRRERALRCGLRFSRNQISPAIF